MSSDDLQEALKSFSTVFDDVVAEAVRENLDGKPSVPYVVLLLSCD